MSSTRVPIWSKGDLITQSTMMAWRAAGNVGRFTWCTEVAGDTVGIDDPGESFTRPPRRGHERTSKSKASAETPWYTNEPRTWHTFKVLRTVNLVNTTSTASSPSARFGV
jgi:hypothetical protein